MTSFLEPNGPEQSASQASGIVPISTTHDNRSAFFVSPSFRPEIATRSHSSSPLHAEQTLAEPQRVYPEIEDFAIQIYEPSRGWHAPASTKERPSGSSNSSNPGARTIEQSRKTLNLIRFRHQRSSVPPSPSSPKQKRRRGRPKGSRNKKPSRAQTRAQIRRESVTREKSTFAKAFRSYQHRQQRSRE